MRVVDLFSGMGGMSLGFERAGYDVVCAIDAWEDALAVYRANFSHDTHCLDLSNVEAASRLIKDYQPDVIIGGPPCQDFSSAGKRDENGGRGDLTISYADIIVSVRPAIFVMENVERIVHTDKLRQAKEKFRMAGYKLSQMVLDASLCGVPQRRKRFILIGALDYPEHAFEWALSQRQSPEPLSIRAYCGDLIPLDYYYRHPRSYARRGIFSIDEPSPTIRGVNRPIPKGYQLHPGDPSKTLEGIRSLTTKERSYIQTFPEDFRLLGTKTALEQMVGNAVPVNLAYYVACAIRERIEGLYKENNSAGATASLVGIQPLFDFAV